MADPNVQLPPYGGVDLYVKILQGARSDWIELSALAILRSVVDDGHWGVGEKLTRIRDVVTAAERVRSVTPMPNLTGLDYSREAGDPTPVSGGRVGMHTGAVTDAGLVDETDAALDEFISTANADMLAVLNQVIDTEATLEATLRRIKEEGE